MKEKEEKEKEEKLPLVVGRRSSREVVQLIVVSPYLYDISSKSHESKPEWYLAVGC